MTAHGDFWELLSRNGYRFGSSSPNPPHQPSPASAGLAQGTTILALKYHDGVLVAGDRRATTGHTVMYDRTDKVLDLDRDSVMAIAGVPATAFEMARVLEHSFKYYRRSQLQDLSLEGKLRALIRLLKDNVPAALSGTGTVAPIFAGYDRDHETARIYFYDILGAEFEGVEYAVSGSGSPVIRGILHYQNVWGEKPLAALDEEEATVLALRLLTCAAEFDSATGGVNYQADLYPVMKLITSRGVRSLSAEHLKPLFESRVAHHV